MQDITVPSENNEEIKVNSPGYVGYAIGSFFITIISIVEKAISLFSILKKTKK
ncbi:MAG: hypothetical protein JWQ09_2159 [Segetibacter sp.]|nr:hypothetical protein [Segetibacter sp.]